MSITKIDFAKTIGEVNPLHGTNSGPRTYGFWMNTTPYFEEAGIPFSRLHDTEYAFGSGEFVDINCIFKDFDADENDPASYDFQQTDEYIKAIYAAGTEVLYRLGSSIEHSPIKVNVHPPKDFKKWAVICEHIIRHFNEGWANGFHFGIRYWEIWNEPETCGGRRKHMWTGTDEQYFELYVLTAKHLKECFGDSIKVGGFASCGFYGLWSENEDHKYFVQYAKDFLAIVKKENAPLDFFSWHLYSKDIWQYETCCKYARELMAEYGFEKAESILDEWNYSGEDMFHRMTTEEGAALCASAMITMQKNGVDVATIYDGQPAMPYTGIFDHCTRTPTKSFYALKGWNELYRLHNAVEASTDGDKQFVYAAADGKNAAVLFAAYGAEAGEVEFDLSGLAFDGDIEVKTYVVDSKTNLCEVKSVEIIDKPAFKLYRNVETNAVVLLKLRAL